MINHNAQKSSELPYMINHIWLITYCILDLKKHNKGVLPIVLIIWLAEHSFEIIVEAKTFCMNKTLEKMFIWISSFVPIIEKMLLTNNIGIKFIHIIHKRFHDSWICFFISYEKQRSRKRRLSQLKIALVAFWKIWFHFLPTFICS